MESETSITSFEVVSSSPEERNQPIVVGASSSVPCCTCPLFPPSSRHISVRLESCLCLIFDVESPIVFTKYAYTSVYAIVEFPSFIICTIIRNPPPLPSRSSSIVLYPPLPHHIMSGVVRFIYFLFLLVQLKHANHAPSPQHCSPQHIYVSHFTVPPLFCSSSSVLRFRPIPLKCTFGGTAVPDVTTTVKSRDVLVVVLESGVRIDTSNSC